MSLKVLRTSLVVSSDKEKTFFELSSQLKAAFAKKKEKAVLVGFPKIFAEDGLSPDAILLVNNNIIIINFKEYSGRIWLPNNEVFGSAIWHYEGKIISSGRFMNPYSELKYQRERLMEMIGGGQRISGIVYFHGDMDIMTSVPMMIREWFYVTNSYQFLGEIEEIIKHGGSPFGKEKILRFLKADTYRACFSVDLNRLKRLERISRQKSSMWRTNYQAKKMIEITKKQLVLEKSGRISKRLRHELMVSRRLYRKTALRIRLKIARFKWVKRWFLFSTLTR